MNGKRREHGGDGQREDINRRRTGSCLKAVSGSLSAGGETGTRSEDMDPLQELLDRVKPSTEAVSPRLTLLARTER